MILADPAPTKELATIAELALAIVFCGKFTEFNVNIIGSIADMKDPINTMAAPITYKELV